MDRDRERAKAKLELKMGDITEMEVDAIVNAANNDLILGGGVAGAIRRKGGDAIQDECNKIGSVPLGEAAITTGGNLKAKHVIHAASMSLGSWTTRESLRNSVKNSLVRAEERKLKTLAFCAIGTGIGGFPLDRCAQIMVDTIIDHVKSSVNLDKVHIVLFDEKNFGAFKEYYDSLK
jgi:O-acetyl-ADP-ribose deacetylase (regulator of RNase III)